MANNDGNTTRVTADIEHGDPDAITIDDGDQDVVVPPHLDCLDLRRRYGWHLGHL